MITIVSQIFCSNAKSSLSAVSKRIVEMLEQLPKKIPT